MMKMSKLARADLRNGMLFALPMILGLLMFTLYPVCASMYYSFTNYNVLQPPEWAGIDNYRVLFTEDNLFRVSLYNTVYYVVFIVPLGIVMGVAIALLLNMKIKGMAIYRTMYFLPTLVPIVATSILWMWVLNPQFGLINSILYKFGIKGPGWIADVKWSKPSLVIMGLWGFGRGMIIYLAGLQDIPEQMYEAAELDGANWWNRTIHITLPMITPVIFFNLIMGLIGSFQIFTQAYIMTEGGPANSTLFYNLYLWRNAFAYFRMGYASSMAWILFLLILASTLVIFKSSARWVYYGGALK